ncbi:MAG: hypothetical protein GF309_13690 [Candidatus Lokiarchaeota archaeon]|nr:hypothetical protein [Candidatus Lokiarchaeota archaeon]
MNSNGKSRYISILAFGVFSTVFAEVFSGSAPLWFIDPWGIIVVLPLYWMHALFLLNLAIRCKRTSMSQLYFWGILFGLYESWITKVLWAGYMGKEPLLGTFLGFAVVEFPIIGLFWHAVFAFILPILVFEIVVISDDESQSHEVLMGHTVHLRESRKNLGILILLFLIGSLFLSNGLEMNLGATLFASVGNSLIVLVLIESLRMGGNNALLANLKLERRGIAANLVILGIIYIVLSVLLVPERWASLFTILLTIGFYGLVCGFLGMSSKNETALQTLPKEGRYISIRRVATLFAFFTGLSTLWCSIPDIGNLVTILIYLGMIPSGFVLLLLSTYMVIRNRTRTNDLTVK